MSLSNTSQTILENAISAIHKREFFAQYPEHPKAYGEEAPKRGLEAFEAQKGNRFSALKQDDPIGWSGEEVSPYTQESLGIEYPLFDVDQLIVRAGKAQSEWKNVSVDQRAEILIDSLERIKERFYDIAYATMHTTGQAFMMSFQASGPHANDRALEALAMGYEELKRFPEEVNWDKPMGKFNVVLKKKFKAVPKGISLCVGCSTFPVWNSVPGIYASLITGNPVIMKPHPKGILSIATVIEEIQNALAAANINPHVVQLAVDSSDQLITKELANHPMVKIIDYTGGSAFGSYLEQIPGKAVFTEKAGVNSVILDSVTDMKSVMQNLAFSVSLYSGQMCTAPQNFFVPETGVETADGTLSYADTVEMLKKNIAGLVSHPKMGAGTLGAIQSEVTLERAKKIQQNGHAVALKSVDVENAEFSKARICAPTVIEVDASDYKMYEQELFGPIVLVIKTKNTDESIKLARKMAEEHGAITCAAYTTSEERAAEIESEMEQAFTPVSLNLTGFIWVNQHAAFSDFHVTGGNPAGNASFTNPEYVNKRFVWVGHRRVG